MKHQECSLPCTAAMTGEDISYTPTHQDELISFFTSLILSQRKEEND